MILLELDDLLKLPLYNRKEKESKIQCVYFVFSANKPVYIGQTKNLTKRIAQHTWSRKCQIRYLAAWRCESPENSRERREMETLYLKKYNPLKNDGIKGCSNMTTKEIKKLLKKYNITQVDLSKHFDCRPQQIFSAIKTGEQVTLRKKIEDYLTIASKYMELK